MDSAQKFSTLIGRKQTGFSSLKTKNKGRRTPMISKQMCGCKMTIALAIGVLTSHAASAETWSPDYRTITGFYPHSGGVSFILDGSAIVPASPCRNRFMLPLGMANYAAIVAGLYSAQAQGKRIQINYDETNFTCDVPVNRFQTENN